MLLVFRLADTSFITACLRMLLCSVDCCTLDLFNYAGPVRCDFLAMTKFNSQYCVVSGNGSHPLVVPCGGRSLKF